MFEFIALGDWGYVSFARQKIADSIKQFYPKTRLIFLGDNFYPAGVEGVHDKQWIMYEKNFGKNPSYAIVGNHDYLGNVNAQISYSMFSNSWNMPALFYDIIQESCHLIFLDTASLAPKTTRYLTEIMGKSFNHVQKNFVHTQLLWLHHVLSRSKSPIKIVFGHYPIFSGGFHGNNQELIDILLPILQKYNVTMYMCGHDHSLQHIERYGIQFFVSGAGSESTKSEPVEGTRYTNNVCGFVHISCKSSNIIASFMSFENILLYQHFLSK